MPKHHLYRHYTADGDLLYIGQSLSAFERFRSHLSNSDWADLATIMRVQRFGSKDAVQQAEIRAIREEKPKYNKKFNALVVPVPSYPIRDFIVVSGPKPRPPGAKRGRPPKGDRAMTPTERSREHRARKKPAADPRSAPSAVVGVGASEGAPIPPPAPRWVCDDDVQLVARLKRVARGEWLDLCELAERLMRG